jgi:oxygen-independent coproporphyrinogen-3 oxidase
VEAAKFAALASAGVNRVSLGVQALDDKVLKFLGRLHGVDEALAALDVAQRHFARTSFDLIYARPTRPWTGKRN